MFVLTEHQDKICKAVRLHAKEQYHNGWAVLVDKWPDSDIAAILGKNPKLSAKGAIVLMQSVVDVHNSIYSRD